MEAANVLYGKEGLKVKNKLTINLGLKILSLFASIVLWLVVNTISNPYITQTFYNIPVHLINTESISNSEKMYSVLDKSDTIREVYVRAPRSVIQEIDADDIYAYADVNEISSLDTVTILYDINLASGQKPTITGNIDTVKLQIEKRATKSLVLVTDTVGNLPEGYIVGDVVANQNLVTITGPESVVDKVFKAYAKVDVTGFTSDIVTDASITFLDSDDRVVRTNGIDANIKNVGMRVSILQTKEVPVSVSVENDAAPGYSVSSAYLTDKDSVTICGKTSAIKKAEGIVIPSEAFDLSDKNDDFVTSIDISNYLPENTTLVDPSESFYEVTIMIKPQKTKHMTITASDIEIKNLPEGYEATIISDEDIVVELLGLETALNKINKQNLAPSVDVSAMIVDRGMTELKDDFYHMDVSFILADNSVEIIDPVSIMVHIVKKSAEQ